MAADCFDRCESCMIVATSFHGKKFEALAKAHAESKSFRKLWDEARDNGRLAASARNFKHVLTVRNNETCGVRMSQFFWFVRVPEWLRLFRRTPASLGFKVEILRDEASQQNIDGVVVTPTPGEALHSYRVLEFFSENCRFVTEDVMTPLTRTREKEPAETYRRLNAIAISKRNMPDRSCKFDQDITLPHGSRTTALSSAIISAHSGNRKHCHGTRLKPSSKNACVATWIRN